MTLEPFIGPCNQLLIEALPAATRLISGHEQDCLPVGVECKSDAPDPVSGIALQLLHVRISGPGEGVGMWSTEQWSFAFQKKRSGKNVILHLRPEFIDFILELFCERNRPLHMIFMPLKLYSLEALILQ